MDQARAPVAPRYLPGLDVVRALAAMAVLACHSIQASTNWSPVWSAAHSAHLATMIKLAMEEAGAWGVGIFFVLSGLCIHLPLARKMAAGAPARLEIGSYLKRRFRRIYPPHLMALAISAALAMALPLAAYGVHPMISAPTIGQLAAHLALVHTLFPWAIYSINHVLWTIATEAHFYLLYPLLLIGRRRFKMPTLCVGLLGFSIALRLAAKLLLWSDGTKLVLERSALCRFWEWALGCWLAERLMTRGVELAPKLWLFLGGLAAIYLLGLGTRHLLPLGGFWSATVLPPLFALAILASCGLAARADALLVRIGRASYSLYLVHPIALSVSLVSLRAAGFTSMWLELGVAVPMAFAATYGFHRWVEAPCMTKPVERAPQVVAAG